MLADAPFCLKDEPNKWPFPSSSAGRSTAVPARTVTPEEILIGSDSDEDLRDVTMVEEPLTSEETESLKEFQAFVRSKGLDAAVHITSSDKRFTINVQRAIGAWMHEAGLD